MQQRRAQLLQPQQLLGGGSAEQGSAWPGSPGWARLYVSPGSQYLSQYVGLVVEERGS